MTGLKQRENDGKENGKTKYNRTGLKGRKNNGSENGKTR